MLRTSFDSATKQDHRDDHRVMHRRNNTAVFVDDYNSIQAALNDAEARNLNTVLLNPAGTYPIDTPIDIPPGIMLDGGRRSFGGHYPFASNAGAKIIANSAMSEMITLQEYGILLGCFVHGNDIATVGVLLQKDIATVESNLFQHFADVDGAAIRAGGVVFARIAYNQIGITAGYGLDALNSYSLNPTQTYYGINHGISEFNTFGADKPLRFEGLMASRNDDFEGVVESEAAAIIGGFDFTTQLDMYSPYFEIRAGASFPLAAVQVNLSAHLNLYGGQIFCQRIADSTAIKSNLAQSLKIIGTRITRVDSGLAGDVANNCAVMIAGIYFSETNIKNALQNTANADISLMHPPVA